MINLKSRAESGDAQAEYDYSVRIQSLDPTQSFDMLLRAARQGHVEAENAVAAHYQLYSAFQSASGKTKMMRLGARFTIEAACMGNAASQARLSDYYQSGDIVPKDPSLAYGWALIAARATDRVPGWNYAYAAKASNLVARTSAEDLQKGQAFADAFPQKAESVLKAFEVDLVSAQLTVNALITISGTSRVIVNHVAFAKGESRTVQVDGEPVELRLVRLDGPVAVFQLFGQEIVLRRS